MMLFTINDIRHLAQILAEEIRGAGVAQAAADLTNPDSDLWLRALQRLAEYGYSEDLERASSLLPASAGRKGRSVRSFEEGNPMNMGVADAARYLRVSTNTIYKWTSQGTIPYRKIGTKNLSFLKEELDQFIASRRVADDREIQERASRVAGKMLLRQRARG